MFMKTIEGKGKERNRGCDVCVKISLFTTKMGQLNKGRDEVREKRKWHCNECVATAVIIYSLYLSLLFEVEEKSEEEKRKWKRGIH